MRYLHSSEPIWCDILSSITFWYMQYLHSAEPKILYIVDLDNVLVYVFFALLRTRVDGELISLNVLVYAYFVQLRTYIVCQDIAKYVLVYAYLYNSEPIQSACGFLR